MGRRQQQRQSLGGQDDGEDVMITSAEACDRLGLSDTWLRKLAEEGVITKQGYRTTTRYPWPKIRVQYLAYRESLLLEGLAGGKERKDLAEAEMAELKLARERGQLVTLAYMEAEVSRILVALRARLQAMPSSWAARLGAAESTVDRQLMLEEAIAELMPLLQSDVIGALPDAEDE
jgi:hypothetical protein